MKIMHKSYFLQQDTKPFAKQEDNKCTSADLHQGSNFLIDAACTSQESVETF